MSNTAGNDANRLAADYGALLRDYIETPTEPAREKAYQLAHRAIAQGHGLLDVVAGHQEAVSALLASAQTTRQGREIAQRASEFLLDCLAPFEMTHRGYRETIQRLVAANEALAQSEAELERRVAERTAELARANEELRTEIIERQRAQEERERAVVEAERRATELDASNKELQAFAYSVSHDLRAPLRHIEGFGKLLLEDYADRLDDRGKEYLDFMIAASNRMDELIDAMLKLSRVMRTEMRRRPVNLSELARTVMTYLQKKEPQRRVEVAIAPNAIANGDPLLLRLVLENLLANAWKFTAHCSIARIEFGVKHEGGKPVYFVKDNGAGFDLAYVGKLFTPFQRLHTKEEFPGTGIGLATVQRIVHRHGGRIWAEGEVDKGATFYFTLP